MTVGHFDIIVIGAGIAGASVAAYLAETHRLLVLERESQPGYHSTGRSAALYSLTYGAEPVRALSRASRDFLVKPPTGFADVPLLRPRGALHIATKEQAETLGAFAETRDVAVVSRRLDGRAARTLCPILRHDAVESAAFEPDAADVEVHALHQGYLRLLRARQGGLLTDCAVENIQRGPGNWIVRTGVRSFVAPIVIDAAGAWADAVAVMAGVEPLGLQPMRRTAVLVDPPEGEKVDDWPMVIDIDERFYFKPDAGQLLLSPADETPSQACDAQPEEWDVALAIDRVEAVTTLKVRRVKSRWAGLRTFAPDRVPVAGYDPQAPGFFWLAGQGGYGIQTSDGLARSATALVLGEPLPESAAAAGVRADDLSPARLRRAERSGQDEGTGLVPDRGGTLGHRPIKGIPESGGG
ncbi:MAG: NAD(P)/FAD-dependent oxidoreductase [Caulobacteraceae bacterium]